MKIVFVNRFFHPDQSATSQLATALAFFLLRVATKSKRSRAVNYTVTARQTFQVLKQLAMSG